MSGYRVLVAIIAIQLLAIVGLGLFWHPVPPRTERQLPPPVANPGGNFELTGARGPVSLTDFRGKAVLLYFGYTFCPDICPTSLLATSAGLRQLSADELKQVQVIFVSVDPERDTPKQLADYVAFFHPNIIGATGTKAQIDDITRRYGVVYRRQATTGTSQYVVDHSAETYLIRPDGRLTGSLPHGAAPEDVIGAIRALLRGQALPALPLPSTGASS
jgi:protein SCO1/2